jgi:hypothetical protein
MAVHEIKKCAKVIDEITTYLLRKGFTDIDLNIHRDSEETKITISLGVCPTELITQFTNAIKSDMDDEIEEYCWELLGESDTNHELSVVGMLIDAIEVTGNQEKTEIILHRYYK